MPGYIPLVRADVVATRSRADVKSVRDYSLRWHHHAAHVDSVWHRKA